MKPSLFLYFFVIKMYYIRSYLFFYVNCFLKNATKSSFVIEIISNPILFKRWSGAKIYPLPALLTPLPLIPFTDKETTVCTNAKGANKAPRDILEAFHVLLFQ